MHFCFRSILESNAIGVNMGTFSPFETRSLTRSEKLFCRFSIIPYPLKIVLSLKYWKKKHLFVEIRPQNLNPVEWTLMEALEQLCEKSKFLSIFFNECVRNALV